MLNTTVQMHIYKYLYLSKPTYTGIFLFTGGTDIIGCFAACCSDLPVYRGEIQCRVLGMAMESWDETGMYLLVEGYIDFTVVCHVHLSVIA